MPWATKPLVLLEPGSYTLSFVANFLDGGSLQIIDSGGTEPVAGLVISNEGEDNLLVANEGDGALALFLAGPDGLSSSPMTMEDPDVPNPTALAYDALSGDVLQFYAATSGAEQATLLQFNLGGQEVGGGGIASPIPAPTSSMPVDVLQPLGESSLAIVSTLLTTTSEVSSVTPSGPSELETSVSVTQGVAGALPNHPASYFQQETTLEEIADENTGDEAAPALPAQGAISPLDRFLYRLDEAIEKARQDARDTTRSTAHPEGAAESSVRAIEAVLARWSSALEVAGGPSRVLLGNLATLGRLTARVIDATPAPASSQPSTSFDSTSTTHSNPDGVPMMFAVTSVALIGVTKLTTGQTRGEVTNRRDKKDRGSSGVPDRWPPA